MGFGSLWLLIARIPNDLPYWDVVVYHYRFVAPFWQGLSRVGFTEGGGVEEGGDAVGLGGGVVRR